MANPGYGTFSQKAIATDIITAGYPNLKTVTIISTCIDGGTAGGGTSTNLKPGTVLGLVSASNKYNDYDYNGSDGTQNEEDVVVLMEEIEDISTGDQTALVATGFCTFNWDKMRWATADDKSNFEHEKCNFAFTHKA